MKLPDLQKFKDIDSFENFLLSDYNEPLHDYVSKLWEKLHPNSEFKILQYYFLRRYQNGLVNQDFLINQNFIDEYYLTETIEGLGFDVNKFWYLVLFISDYTYCKCKLGVGLNKSPQAKIDELIAKIVDNIVSVNQQETKVEVKNQVTLSLEIEGNGKFVIGDERTIYHIAKLLKLQSDGSDDLLMKYAIPDIQKKILDREDEKKFTTHFWYFANLFQKFFEAMPPKRRRSPNDSNLSYNKLLLISRIAYLTGLVGKDKTEYLFSDDPIKGILSKSQEFKLKGMLNPLYNNL